MQWFLIHPSTTFVFNLSMKTTIFPHGITKFFSSDLHFVCPVPWQIPLFCINECLPGHLSKHRGDSLSQPVMINLLLRDRMCYQTITLCCPNTYWPVWRTFLGCIRWRITPFFNQPDWYIFLTESMDTNNVWGTSIVVTLQERLGVINHRQLDCFLSDCSGNGIKHYFF